GRAARARALAGRGRRRLERGQGRLPARAGDARDGRGGLLLERALRRLAARLLGPVLDRRRQRQPGDPADLRHRHPPRPAGAGGVFAPARRDPPLRHWRGLGPRGRGRHARARPHLPGRRARRPLRADRLPLRLSPPRRRGRRNPGHFGVRRQLDLRRPVLRRRLAPAARRFLRPPAAPGVRRAAAFGRLPSPHHRPRLRPLERGPRGQARPDWRRLRLLRPRPAPPRKRPRNRPRQRALLSALRAHDAPRARPGVPGDDRLAPGRASGPAVERPVSPSRSAPRTWQVWVDTGGTFTDCLAVAPRGEIHRVKVLSSSALRGRIAARRGARSLVLDGFPALPPGFFAGFAFRLLGGGEEWPAVGWDPESRRLDLAVDLPDLPPGAACELASMEEPPVLAARIATGTPPDRPLPPLAMRL